MPDSAWNANTKRVLRAETFVTRGWKSLALVIGINLLGAAPAVLLAVSGKPLEPGMLAVSLLCALLFRGRHFEAAFVLWLILPVVYLFAVGAPLRRRARESLAAAMKVCPDQAGMDALPDKVSRSEKWASALPLLLTTLHLILFLALGRIVLR